MLWQIKDKTQLNLAPLKRLSSSFTSEDFLHSEWTKITFKMEENLLPIYYIDIQRGKQKCSMTWLIFLKKKKNAS